MKESGGVTSFDNMPQEEPEFLDWTAQHDGDYVLNHLSENRFLLHHAYCDRLNDSHPEALANTKHCADTEDLLLPFSKGEPPRCPKCYLS